MQDAERNEAMRLTDMETGGRGCVCAVRGDDRFLSRIFSMGVTEGCRFTVVQNRKKYPVLVHVRDSAIAIDRSDCDRIEVEVSR